MVSENYHKEKKEKKYLKRKGSLFDKVIRTSRKQIK